MKVFNTLNTLLVECLLVRGSVEVQVAAKYLITTFTTHNHLHPHSFDLPTKEVHRRAGANRRDVVRLKVVNHIGDRVETLLHGESIFMMDSSQVMRRFSRG